jgi:hypothetical protein
VCLLESLYGSEGLIVFEGLLSLQEFFSPPFIHLADHFCLIKLRFDFAWVKHGIACKPANSDSYVSVHKIALLTGL